MLKFKRVFALILATLMILQGLTAFALVDYDVNGSTDTTKVKLDEFTSGTDTGDAAHGGAKKISADIEMGYSSFGLGSIPNDNTGKYIISFDYFANVTTGLYSGMLKQKVGDKEYQDFSGFGFDMNGKIVVTKDGRTIYGAKEGASDRNDIYNKTIGDYAANRWGNLAAVVTPGRGADARFDWYVNGEFKFSQTNEYPMGKNDNFTGNAINMFIRPTIGESKSSDGTTNYVQPEGSYLYIDNLKVTYCDITNGKFFGELSFANNTINVKFNEVVSSTNNLTGIKLKAADGSEIALGAAAQLGDTLTIPVTGELEGDLEYTLVLPNDFSSISGNKIANNAMCFTTATVAPAYTTYATMEEGFSSMADDANNTKVEFPAGSENYVFKRSFTGPSASTTQKTITDYTLGNYDYGDLEFVSMDYYFDELVKTDTINICGSTGSEKIGSYYFDHKGHFVVISPNAVGTEPDWKIFRGDQTVAETPKYTNVKYVSGITTGKWYTVKAIINKTEQTVTYLLGSTTDGVYSETNVGTVHYIANHNKGAQFLRVMSYPGYGMTDKTDGSSYYYYMDNFRHGFAFDSTKESLAAETTYTTNDTRAKFTTSEALADKYAVSFDVTSSSVDLNANKFYMRNANNAMISLVRTAGEGKVGVAASGKAGWWWTAECPLTSVGETVKDGGLVAGKPYNVTVLVNKAKSYQSTYVNGNLILTKKLDANLGTDNNPFDIKEIFSGGEGYTISNAKLVYNTDITKVSCVRIVDSSNEEFSPYSNDIYASVNKVNLTYTNALAAGTTVAATLQRSPAADGEMMTGVSAAISANDAKVVEVALPTLSNGTYKLTVTADGAKNYTQDFVINDNRTFRFTNVSLQKVGTTYSATAEIDNPVSLPVEYVLIIAEYTNDIAVRLVQVDFVKMITNEQANVALEGVGEGHTVKAFIWKNFNTLIPLLDAIEE